MSSPLGVSWAPFFQGELSEDKRFPPEPQEGGQQGTLLKPRHAASHLLMKCQPPFWGCWAHLFFVPLSLRLSHTKALLQGSM